MQGSIPIQKNEMKVLITMPSLECMVTFLEMKLHPAVQSNEAICLFIDICVQNNCSALQK